MEAFWEALILPAMAGCECRTASQQPALQRQFSVQPCCQNWLEWSDEGGNVGAYPAGHLRVSWFYAWEPQVALRSSAIPEHCRGDEGGKLVSSAPEPQGVFEGQGDGLSWGQGAKQCLGPEGPSHSPGLCISLNEMQLHSMLNRMRISISLGATAAKWHLSICTMDLFSYSLFSVLPSCWVFLGHIQYSHTLGVELQLGCSDGQPYRGPDPGTFSCLLPDTWMSLTIEPKISSWASQVTEKLKTIGNWSQGQREEVAVVWPKGWETGSWYK